MIRSTFGRPPHLAELGGKDAVRPWRTHLAGDAGALRLFAEYDRSAGTTATT